MLTEIMRRVMWRRRLRAARAWQEAARRQAAEHNAAVRRILGQAERAA
ncbi:hypothetical protein [Actinoplanes xinjiangensis]|uniref:Uncharacterized protein n=1 Tax=Actinoplanes xinjiangensis TaxID=512350 RepID=A0A316FZR7_9ACTN|nr:hypothetical protein [Actinoplanes xinjiangensis]PWK47657.1 hypothetical protein BC793_107267 [Actinoplanes xinjiangensis]